MSHISVESLVAENVELRDMLANERQENISLSDKLVSMSAIHVISDLVTKENRKEIADSLAALGSRDKILQIS